MGKRLPKVKIILTLFLIISFVGTLIVPHALLADLNPIDPDATQQPGVYNQNAANQNEAAVQKAEQINQGGQGAGFEILDYSHFDYTGETPQQLVGDLQIKKTDNGALIVTGTISPSVSTDASFWIDVFYEGTNFVRSYNWNIVSPDSGSNGLAIGSSPSGNLILERHGSVFKNDDNFITDDGDFQIVLSSFQDPFQISEILFTSTQGADQGAWTLTPTHNGSSEPTPFVPSSSTSEPQVTPFHSNLGNEMFSENPKSLLSTHNPLSVSTPVLSNVTGLIENDRSWLSEKIGLTHWDLPLSHTFNAFKPMILKAAEGFMNYSRLDPLNIKALLNQAMERTEFSKVSPVIEAISKILDFIPNNLGGLLKTLFQFFEGLQERIYQKHLLALRPYYESLWNGIIKPLQGILEKLGILIPEKPELQDKVSKEEITWMQAMDQAMKKIIYLYQKNSLPQSIRSKLTLALSREAELHERFITPLKGLYENELKDSLINFILKLKERLLIKPNSVEIGRASCRERV